MRLGPLELMILLVCGGGLLLVVGGGVVYWIIRSATKAGIKDATKEEPKKNNPIINPHRNGHS